MTQEEKVLLLRRAARQFADLASKEATKLQKSYSCTHSDTYLYTWIWDNGYGVQKKKQGTCCYACEAQSPYNDGVFRKPL